MNEEGAGFSGGQIQRIFIARGMVYNKQLWLIDEATSALDKAAVLDIENRLLSLDKVTMVIISHHVSSNLLSKVDGEFHLKQGKITTRVF